MNRLGLIFASLTALAVVFLIAAAAAPNWVQGNGGNAGLWKSCGGGNCVSFDNADCKAGNFVIAGCSSINGTRAFILLSLLVCVAAACLQFLIAFEKYSNAAIAGILGIVAGIFGLIAMAIYAGYFNDQHLSDSGYSLDACFGLCIVAWILALFSGIVFLVQPGPLKVGGNTGGSASATTTS